MAKNLPLNAKDFYEGKNPFVEVEKGAKTLLATMDEMQKKLVAVNQELGKSMRGNTKETSKDYQVLNDQLSKSQQNTAALNKINEEKARLEATLLKLNKQSQQENEELNLLIQNQKKANKELAKEQLGLVTNYDRLVKKTNEAQKRFKDLAAEFGVNSKQANEAKESFDKLDSVLRKINEGAKDGKRDIGRYKDEIKEALAEQDIFGTSFNKIKGLFTTATGIITGVVAGIAALGKAYTSSARGAEDLAQAQDRLSSIGKQVGNSIADLTGEAGFLDAFVRSFQQQLFGIGSTIKSDIEVAVLSVIRQLGILEIDQERQKKKQLDDAEKLRQIRDDERKSIDERIKANEDLGKVISEREEATIKFQNEKLKYFKLLLALDEGNIEIQKQVKQIEFEIADAREEAQGFRSKQLKKEKTLLKENYDNELNLKKLQIENQLIFVAKGTDQELKLRKNLIDITKEIEVKAAGENEALRKIAIQNAINNTNLLFEEYRKQKALEQKQIEDIDKFLNDEFAKQTDEIKIKEYDPSSSFDAAEKARQDEINAEIAKFEALKSINESGYSSIFDIFSKWATKKKAKEENMSADEIAALEKANKAKVQAVEELVNTLISIYTELLDSRIQDLETEINATNQKINETEQALNRETSLQEQGAANNVAIEKQKLERLQQERDKDLQEQKKLQKERDKVNKLTQISSLITAIANIINQYSNQGPQGWILGLLAASAAVIGYISASGEAESAVGEEGELLTKKGTYLESGKRHSRGGNKYSSAEFEEGEAHAIFSRDATRRNYKDIKQFTDLVNSGKWDLYKSQIGGNLNSIIVNNDYEKLLNEQRKTNQILQNQIRPVYNNNGKLVKFNINGVMIKAEI